MAVDVYIGSIAEKGMELLDAHRLDIPVVSELEGLSREARWVVYLLVGMAATETFNVDSVHFYGSAGPMVDKPYREIFYELTDKQKTAVYEIVGRIIEYYSGGPFN